MINLETQVKLLIGYGKDNEPTMNPKYTDTDADTSWLCYVPDSFQLYMDTGGPYNRIWWYEYPNNCDFLNISIEKNMTDDQNPFRNTNVGTVEVDLMLPDVRDLGWRSDPANSSACSGSTFDQDRYQGAFVQPGAYFVLLVDTGDGANNWEQLFVGKVESLDATVNIDFSAETKISAVDRVQDMKTFYVSANVGPREWWSMAKLAVASMIPPPQITIDPQYDNSQNVRVDNYQFSLEQTVFDVLNRTMNTVGGDFYSRNDGSIRVLSFDQALTDPSDFNKTPRTTYLNFSDVHSTDIDHQCYTGLKVQFGKEDLYDSLTVTDHWINDLGGGVFSDLKQATYEIGSDTDAKSFTFDSMLYVDTTSPSYDRFASLKTHFEPFIDLMTYIGPDSYRAEAIEFYAESVRNALVDVGDWVNLKYGDVINTTNEDPYLISAITHDINNDGWLINAKLNKWWAEPSNPIKSNDTLKENK